MHLFLTNLYNVQIVMDMGLDLDMEKKAGGIVISGGIMMAGWRGIVF